MCISFVERPLSNCLVVAVKLLLVHFSQHLLIPSFCTLFESKLISSWLLLLQLGFFAAIWRFVHAFNDCFCVHWLVHFPVVIVYSIHVEKQPYASRRWCCSIWSRLTSALNSFAWYDLVAIDRRTVIVVMLIEHCHQPPSHPIGHVNGRF